MALSTVERRILIAARNRLKEHKNTYICTAIEAVRIARACREEVAAAKTRLRRYIVARLEGYSSLNGWLNEGAEIGEGVGGFLAREARIAWITWMLGEEPEFDESVKEHLDRFMVQRAKYIAKFGAGKWR